MIKRLTTRLLITLGSVLLFYLILFFLVLLPLLHQPAFQNYLRDRINEILAKDQISFDYTTLHVQTFPLKISIHGLTVRKHTSDPEPTTAFAFETASVMASLSLTRLAYGRILFKELNLINPRIFVDLNRVGFTPTPAEKRPGPRHLEAWLHPLLALTRSFLIERGEVIVEAGAHLLRVAQVNLSGMSSLLSLAGNLNLEEVTVSGPDFPLEIPTLTLEYQADLNALNIREMTLTHLSDTQIKVWDTWLSYDWEYRVDRFEVSTSDRLLPFLEKVSLLRPALQTLPQLTGTLFLTGSLRGQKNQIPSGKAHLKAWNATLNRKSLGEVAGDLELNLEELLLENVKVESETHWGKLMIPQMALGLQVPHALKGTVVTEGLRFSQFMHFFGITGCLAFMNLAGPVEVKGSLNPLSLTGVLDLRVSNLQVPPTVATVRDESARILQLNSAEIKGGFAIDAQKTLFKAVRVTSGNSSLEVNGGIEHAPIDVQLTVQTETLDLTDLDKLADLTLGGRGPLEANIRVNDGGLWIEGSVNFTQARVEPFFLGPVKTKVSFSDRDNILRFTEASIQQGNTDIEGDVKVHLNTPLTLELESQILSMHADYVKAFLGPSYDAFLGPLTGGMFKGHVSLRGPPMPSKLQGRFDLTGVNLEYFREQFDRLQAQAEFGQAMLTFSNTWIQKGPAKITLKGHLGKGSEYHLQLSSDPIPLSSLSHLRNNQIPAAGTLSVQGSLEGPFETPSLDLNIQMPNGVLGGQPLPISLWASIQSRKHQWDLKLGQRDQTWVQGLIHSETLDYSVEAWLQDFPFLIPIGFEFPHLLKTPLLGSLTGTFKLEGTGASLMSSHLRVSDLWIGRPEHRLRVAKPMSASFRQDEWPWKLVLNLEDSTEVASQIQILLHENLDFGFQASGSLDLIHANALTQILDQLTGVVSGDVTMEYRNHRWVISTHQGIQGNKIGIKFPFMPEEIQLSNLVISGKGDNRFKLMGAQGSLGGGTVQVNGEFGLEPSTLKPQPQLTVQLIESTLTLPQCLKSQMNGRLKLTGSDFPYLLSGSVDIVGGRNTCPLSRFAEPTTDLEKILKARPQPLSSIEFDLNIRSASESFLANYKFFTSRIGGTLLLKGLPETYQLTGTIESANGALMFRNHEFAIEKFQLTFDAGDFWKSRLYLTGNTQIENHQIRLTATGLLEDYQLEFTSSPSLPQRDILSLVLFGTLSTNLDQANQSELLQYEVGSSLISQVPITKSVEQETGLSFQLRSTYDSDSESSQGQLRVGRKLGERVSAEFYKGIGEEPVNKATLGYELSNSVKMRASLEDLSQRQSRISTGPQRLGVDISIKSEFD
jgi:hypothetical protein